MGKNVFYAALLFALLPLTGCVADDFASCDYDICPNVHIGFEMENGKELLNHIGGVDVGIFDGEGNYIRTERIAKADIERKHGFDTYLGQGDHRLVFWANADAATRLVKPYAGGAWEINYAEGLISGDRKSVTGFVDPLYYAPNTPVGRILYEPQNFLPVKVRPGETFSGNVVFTNAYRTITILMGDTYIAAPPQVSLTGLPAGVYYSGMGRIPGAVTHTVQSVLTTLAGKNYAMARFRVFRFEDSNNVGLIVHGPGGAGDQGNAGKPSDDIYDNSIEGAIIAGGGDVNEVMEQAEIELVLSHGGLSGTVQVTIPEWGKDDVNAE